MMTQADADRLITAALNSLHGLVAKDFSETPSVDLLAAADARLIKLARGTLTPLPPLVVWRFVRQVEGNADVLPRSLEFRTALRALVALPKLNKLAYRLAFQDEPQQWKPLIRLFIVDHAWSRGVQASLDVVQQYEVAGASSHWASRMRHLLRRCRTHEKIPVELLRLIDDLLPELRTIDNRLARADSPAKPKRREQGTLEDKVHDLIQSYKELRLRVTAPELAKILNLPKKDAANIRHTDSWKAYRPLIRGLKADLLAHSPSIDGEFRRRGQR